MFSPNKKPKEYGARPFRKNESFNNENEEDVISDSSNDILATIDGVRLETDNVSSFYNNAAVTQSVFSNDSNSSPWSTTRHICVLTPAFALEFARTLASLFILINSFILPTFRMILVFSSGLLGVVIVQLVGRNLRTSSNLKKSTIIKYFVAYQIFVTLSTSLITGASWGILSVQSNTTNLNLTHSFAHGWMLTEKAPPLFLSILLMIGYILVTTSLGSGQYILMSLVSRMNTGVSPQNTSTVIVLWTAAGGLLAGLFGIIDTGTKWCTWSNCLYHVTADAAVMSTIAIFLFVLCFSICAGSFYIEAILRGWRRFLKLWERYVVLNDEDSRQQRNTNTTQEDFDESAPLLQASGTSFSSNQFADNSVASQNALIDTEDVTSRKMYNHQITVAVPTLRKMLKRKDFLTVTLAVFLLFLLSTTFQYYSTLYISETVFNTNETATSAIEKTKRINAILDKKESVALKLASAGTLDYNLIFLIVFWNRKWISIAVNSALKPWLCPMVLLTMFVMITTLVSTYHGAIYLVVCFVFGLVKAMESEILHTVTRRLDKSWPPVEEHDLNTIPRTFIWSLVPATMVMSAILVSPLSLTTGNVDVSMIYVIILSVILALCFAVSRHVTVF